MRHRLEGLLQHALNRAKEGGALKLESLPPLFFEVPKDSAFGDLASTVALGLARGERKAPRAIAEAIIAHLEDPEGLLAGVEIAGPGYLNFRFSPRFWAQTLRDIERPDFGRPNLGGGRRVLVEFVSANPTGPLHVGHGRGAVLGDAVSRLLAFAGYDVTREYYVNDAGKQVATLARSAYARLLQAYGVRAEIPEDGYPGDYLRELIVAHRDELLHDIGAATGTEIPGLLRGAPADLAPGADEAVADAAASYLHLAGDTALSVCGRRAAAWLLEQIKEDMRAIAVVIDAFVSERALHEAGVVGRALDEMAARGFIYEKDGARWFRSESFGDEKDRVVQRSDGELTYFAADIGYHGEKVSRGYDELIDVWGADHHGYVKRVAAAIQALGSDPKKFQVILVQLVRLTRGGEPVRMGKRTGEFVTLREVVDEVGPDATRFFFLMRKGDSQLEFDLELATRQSSENPVFYVQYAHARICTLFRKAAEEGVAVPDAAGADLEALVEAEEQEVVRLLAQMPDVIEDAAAEREPHRVVFHLIEIAGAFHRCYNRHRILGVEPRVRDARLYLARAVQRVLQLGLELLGVRAPESM
ncbi:MAG TPA: arginine--tRNA ligase [Candidatus Dormibacteraeota bacterium]|nr:arginine--tRNA ligase [Candidatus Dormibacteraeota bacterium]